MGKPMQVSNPTAVSYVVCIRNDGVPASLEIHKIYAAIPGPGEDRSGMLRVIDESGEDYLYPAGWFVPIDLSREFPSAPGATRRPARHGDRTGGKVSSPSVCANPVSNSNNARPNRLD